MISSGTLLPKLVEAAVSFELSGLEFAVGIPGSMGGAVTVSYTHLDVYKRQGLSEVMEGRTSIIIAKRLSTIRGADKIVILKDGRVSQVGTHLELLSQPGFYKRLFESQFADEDVELALNLELGNSAQGI